MASSTLTSVKWVSIKGYEGLYEVSSSGNVRSLPRVDPRGQIRKGIVLRPRLGSYRQVGLCKDGVVARHAVYRLVLISFQGLPPTINHKHVDHVNQIKTDDRLENLRWATCSQNTLNSARCTKSTSGVPGVSWYARRQMWMAYSPRVDGILKNLGIYGTIEEAREAVLKYQFTNAE